jgi:hypothetical protein
LAEIRQRPSAQTSEVELSGAAEADYYAILVTLDARAHLLVPVKNDAVIAGVRAGTHHDGVYGRAALAALLGLGKGPCARRQSSADHQDGAPDQDAPSTIASAAQTRQVSQPSLTGISRARRLSHG